MPIRDLTVHAFADQLAARTPVPGGGAVAAVTAAHAAALGAMAVEFTLGKPKFAAHEAANAAALARLVELRTQALALADRDAAAYAQLNALWKLPKDAPERAAGWDTAVAEAIEAPQAILDAACEVAVHCTELSELGHVNAGVSQRLCVNLAGGT